MSYSKLFTTLVTSTVWREPDHVRLVWITMLALKDRDGIVEASVPGLADLARVPLDRCVEALARLAAPDPWSRTKDHEGRRIEEVLGGWRVRNHELYQDRDGIADKRAKDAARQQRRRDRLRASHVTERDAALQVTPPDVDADADAEVVPSSALQANVKTDPVSPATAGPETSPDGPAPQATTANAASATTAPGNGESGRAPGLPGIDPGPARGAAAKRREAAASEQRVFSAWQEAMGRPDAVLDAPRRRRIAWAVREYGEARAVAAIRGCAATPWNMGENKERKRWDDLTLIFRDATHVERFLAADAVHGGEKSAREKAAAVARELRGEGGGAAE